MSETERIDTLKALQKRIREATGPDAELDFEIARTLFPSTWPHKEWPLHFYINNGWRMPDLYTTYPDGLGACVALMLEVLPNFWNFAVGSGTYDYDNQIPNAAPDEKFCWARIFPYDRQHEGTGNQCGRTPSLAILSAIFSALIAEIEAKERVGS